MNKFQSVFLGGIVALTLLTPSAYADTQNYFPVGRYLTMTSKPLAAQSDLLMQTFKIKFPYSVKTIGEANDYLLRFSGYSLVNYPALPISAQHLMRQPLPEVDRTLGPISLKEALLTLAGPPFCLLVDPVHRLISFKLMSNYTQLYKTA